MVFSWRKFVEDSVFPIVFWESTGENIVPIYRRLKCKRFHKLWISLNNLNDIHPCPECTLVSEIIRSDSTSIPEIIICRQVEFLQHYQIYPWALCMFIYGRCQCSCKAMLYIIHIPPTAIIVLSLCAT